MVADFVLNTLPRPEHIQVDVRINFRVSILEDQNKKLLLDAEAESQPLRKDHSGRVLPLTKAVKEDKLEHASAIEASITGNGSPHDIQKRRNIGD